MSDEDRNVHNDDFTTAGAAGVATKDENVPAGADGGEIPFAEARARALAEFDRTYLTAALARHSGNIARTARSLGLHRQSLQKLMARRGIKSGRAVPTPE
jgi:DNA-binding NtrC family response regulator